MDNNIITSICSFADTNVFLNMVKAFGPEFYEIMKTLSYVEEIDLTDKYGAFEIFVEFKEDDITSLADLVEGSITLYEDFQDFKDHYKTILEPWLDNKHTKGTCIMTTLKPKYSTIVSGYKKSAIFVFTNKRRFMATLQKFTELEKQGILRFNNSFGIRIPLSYYKSSPTFFTTVRLFRNKYLVIDYIFKCDWLYSEEGLRYIDIPLKKVRQFLPKKV